MHNRRSITVKTYNLALRHSQGQTKRNRRCMAHRPNVQIIASVTFPSGLPQMKKLSCGAPCGCRIDGVPRCSIEHDANRSLPANWKARVDDRGFSSAEYPLGYKNSGRTPSVAHCGKDRICNQILNTRISVRNDRIRYLHLVEHCRRNCPLKLMLDVIFVERVAPPANKQHHWNAEHASARKGNKRVDRVTKS